MDSVPQLPDVSPSPEDSEQELTPEQERVRRLDALAESLAKKRTEAIEARASSGIERQWLEDEEFYQGIDDANRNEHASSWRTKPPGQAHETPANTTRSTAFPNITRPYCDAAAARIADILLPTDDRSWSLRPTPIADLVSMVDGEIPADIEQQLRSVQGATEESIQQMRAAVVEQANKMQEDAKDASERSQKRIEDWQVEGQWHAEVRKVIEDASRCGSGVLKGPMPIKRRKMALVDAAEAQQAQAGAEGQPAKPNLLQRVVTSLKSAMGVANETPKTLVMKDEISPTSKRIDFWNFYPDGACGENLHNGSFTWERDDISERQVRELADNPHYIKEQIEAVLKEGPKQAVAPNKQEPDKNLEGRANDSRFEIWYYCGDLSKEDLLAAGCECEDDEVRPVIPAMLEIINNRVIKAAFNPLDTGDFPYDIMPWQRKSGLPWGNGVSRQGRTAQRITISAVRNMMDNGGLSAGPQIVLNQGMITPADGQWSLTPRKLWYLGEDADIDDVRKAMHFFEVPSRQEELQNIMNIGMKLMEDSTGLPMLLQGQLGTAPDTVGGMQMLNNNASAVLRRLARTFDDYITEPHIRRYYAWLLQYGNDDEKGDFVVDARGSSALVERDLQAQEIPQMAGIVGNPVFGLDPKKWAREMLKSRKLDPKNFEFDDADWKKIVENMGKGPADPRLEVAQLNAELKLQLAQLDNVEREKDRQLQAAIALIDERLGQASLSSSERQSLEKIKAGLAETAMKLTTQKQLSIGNHVAKAATPPTEPAGKAPAGKAFQA